MTDRDRLLEQVREAEKMAAATGDWAQGAIKLGSDDVYYWAEKAAHYGLTAIALRRVIECDDSLDTEFGLGMLGGKP